MKNDMIAFPREVLFSELQFGVKHAKAGVKRQPTLHFGHLNVILFFEHT
jgi:hypothetical protein